ncbi:DUF3575 domain-containing protein [Fluviispira multicolorata]|uniref:DUF3575 domain-containing protein n=1 Tax=Fluviispira multicolorata TaxID=2654512 RepID=A0A833JF35_9BACT|nr:DUF3575 domain-containing protein [Fluviispira multicolorata]KAB8033531.1 DUF3575 domain-containing protein [Fluviispira multicolorata]
MRIFNILRFIAKSSLLYSSSLFGQTNYLIEGNGLLFINQGFGIDFEYKHDSSLSQGIDFEFFIQNPYNSNGVNAKRNIYTIAPKLRFYFINDKMEGPFMGVKVFFTSSNSSISDSDTSSTDNFLYFAPTLQIGYRFISENKFSLSAYIGVGIKSKNNEFSDAHIPTTKQNNTDWQKAQNKLNLNTSQFQPDYGITFGYIF